ncbi:MAG: tetratricopeptide repeat protein [Desulfovibrio sp.]|jgi:tetratricopeptide (TPR) repeat protein|nr:tetratricopeptide repeat protein [Desulfovibrio sp.]
MTRLSSLLSRLPETTSIRMVTMGHVLWVCRQENCSAALYQTLLNYGGMQLVADEEQSLWFFFTDDVFLALARLIIWGDFNDLPACIELFPSRLKLDVTGKAGLDVDSALQSQEILVRDHFEVFVHPKSREGKKGMPGIDFESAPGRQGMCPVDWATIKVDARMPYASTQSWFAVIHPLGNPLDKRFQTGWDSMFKRVDGILQNHKMKSIVHENFLMVAVDNLLMLRTFLRDYLECTAKESLDPGAYWPCVCVAADRKNLNFNIDLPKKIGLQWDNLMPDYPYISYRNAYLLGEGFLIKDIKYSGEQASIDSWCNVLSDDKETGRDSIPLLMAGHLTAGDKNDNEGKLCGCFYCGIQSHMANDCPTRVCAPCPPDLWERMGDVDLDEINESFRAIEKTLAQSGNAGFPELLNRPDTTLLTQAVLSNSPLSQLRHVEHYWLTRLHASEDGEELQQDDSPCWKLLKDLATAEKTELSDVEKRLTEATLRHQRDARLRMLQGFLYVEKNDPDRASNYFREAASLTPLPTYQAWNEYLQARLSEETSHYSQAIEQYAQVLRIMPDWQDAVYRGIVCRVKMGFADQVLEQIAKLIREEPLWFNRFLVDPALERGQLQILTFLHGLWDGARQKADDERGAINNLEERLHRWFPDDHPTAMQLDKKFRELTKLCGVKNYMAFLQVSEERKNLEKDLNERIREEVDELREQYKNYLTVLQSIRDEASWFPFPGALREFSAEFNECAGIINRAYASNFNEAESFQTAKGATGTMTKLLRSLKRRLRSLRMVRDATLFVLILSKTFIFLEIIGLALCFIGVPLVIYFGDYLHLGWLQEILGENQWSIQKVLIAIITITSLGMAALRSTLSFEKRREKLLDKAKEQREKSQQARLERIRRQRKTTVEQT